MKRNISSKKTIAGDTFPAPMDTKKSIDREWFARMMGDTIRGKPCLSNMGLLIVEMIIGYEWFMSGLVKIARGDFPAGLAEELVKKTAAAAPWYDQFLRSAVIPNAVAYGYAIEISELLAGIALIVGPLVWLVAWHRISDGLRYFVLLAIAAAAIGGAFLAINLHIANAGSHPWLIPGSSFDEGIDLDSILPAVQIVIAIASILIFRSLRRIESDRNDASIPFARPHHETL